MSVHIVGQCKWRKDDRNFSTHVALTGLNLCERSTQSTVSDSEKVHFISLDRACSSLNDSRQVDMRPWRDMADQRGQRGVLHQR